ncbi:MAG: hypothetical protein HQL21_09885, partial [Candidatus Omnitrophica bacterium]|nr:hypothetical protein [Candidatus Omnitrophota bacterium]
GERTFYREIKKVPAGSWVLIDEDAHVIDRQQWWSVSSLRAMSCGRPLDSYIDEFQALFSSAVHLRLIADVPLGAFLSSGIDSVSIAAEMAKVSRPTFFTIGFGDDENDETKSAARVAQELGGEHHRLQMEASDFDLLEDAVKAMDEPYGDPIILPTYLLARKAAEKVKVVLTGDGADEILGGYVHQDFFRRMPKFPGLIRRVLSMSVRGMPVGVLDRAFRYPASMGLAGRERLSQLLAGDLRQENEYLSFAELFTKASREMIYSPEFLRQLNSEPDEDADVMRDHFARNDIGIFDKVLQWDLKHWFPEQTLMKLDRLTMAHSLEGRCPYADYRLVEFFLKMPFDVYNKLSQGKTIVRDIYQSGRQYLPRKKKPFYLPMHRAFDERLRHFQKDVFSSGVMGHLGWFKPEAVKALLSQREQSPLLMDKQIMSLAVLLRWVTHKQ